MLLKLGVFIFSCLCSNYGSCDNQNPGNKTVTFGVESEDELPMSGQLMDIEEFKDDFEEVKEGFLKNDNNLQEIYTPTFSDGSVMLPRKVKNLFSINNQKNPKTTKPIDIFCNNDSESYFNDELFNYNARNDFKNSIIHGTIREENGEFIPINPSYNKMLLDGIPSESFFIAGSHQSNISDSNNDNEIFHSAKQAFMDPQNNPDSCELLFDLQEDEFNNIKNEEDLHENLKQHNFENISNKQVNFGQDNSKAKKDD